MFWNFALQWWAVSQVSKSRGEISEVGFPECEHCSHILKWGNRGFKVKEMNSDLEMGRNIFRNLAVKVFRMASRFWNLLCKNLILLLNVFKHEKGFLKDKKDVSKQQITR